MQPETQNGLWWRASEYSILEEDGSVRIAPSPAATLEEYNPWGAYPKRTRGTRILFPPYLALLELARRLQNLELEGEDRARSRPVPEAEGILHELEAARRGPVMEFVKANGLLGILPIFGVAIRFPLVPSGTIRLLPSPYAKWHITSPEPATLMKQEGYVRLGGEWTKTDVRFIVRGDDRKNLPKAGVTLLRADCIGTEEWPLSALRSYFPSLDPSRQCPHPGTQDFFRHYAESIDGIRELAMHFLEAVTDLGDHHVGPKHLLNAAAFWISARTSTAPGANPNTPLRKSDTRQDCLRVTF